ncbi:MAG: hypothetical protein GY937_02525 [bacterium]|nr:hypothetical protein [bacterium]
MNVPNTSYSGADQRSYYRVSTFLPVRCRRVIPSEIAGLTSEIQTREAPDVSRVDPGLAEWLDRVETKLDRILARFETEEESWMTSEGALEVTLSGSGIRFPVCEEVALDSDVLMEITIPGTPNHTVLSIGRVAECEAEGKSVTIATGFRVIAECDRDAVIAHVLEIQRSELRQRAMRDE